MVRAQNQQLPPLPTRDIKGTTNTGPLSTTTESIFTQTPPIIVPPFLLRRIPVFEAETLLKRQEKEQRILRARRVSRNCPPTSLTPDPTYDSDRPSNRQSYKKKSAYHSPVAGSLGDRPATRRPQFLKSLLNWPDDPSYHQLSAGYRD